GCMTGGARPGTILGEPYVREVCSAEVSRWALRGRRVLMIVPDNTRTAPMDLMFRVLYELIAPEAKALDVLIALGTHPPMSDEAINQRLGITERDRAGVYSRTQFLNHRWADPSQLVSIGSISEAEVESISGGLMRES